MHSQQKLTSFNLTYTLFLSHLPTHTQTHTHTHFHISIHALPISYSHSYSLSLSLAKFFLPWTKVVLSINWIERKTDFFLFFAPGVVFFFFDALQFFSNFLPKTEIICFAIKKNLSKRKKIQNDNRFLNAYFEFIIISFEVLFDWKWNRTHVDNCHCHH